MSDIATGEMPIDPVQPPPPALEADAEVEAAAPDAAPRDAAASEAPAAEPALQELDHPVGSLRQAVLDHLLDSEGPQTVAQIIAGLGGTVSRNTCESVIRRAYAAGEVERVAPGRRTELDVPACGVLEEPL
jgi:hypothetical protein